MSVLAPELGNRALAAPGPASEQARRAVARSIQAAKDREFHSLGLVLGYQYHASPVIVEDGTPPLPESQAYSPTARPGARLPHTGRVLVIRPGLIVGPHDPTDRFTYWPHRIARGGQVLAPGDPEQPVQFIDARDLAAWTIAMVEARQTGVYNAKGPADTLTMRQLLERCRETSGSDARFEWVSEPFLLEHEVAPYTQVPLWVPGEMVGFSRVNCGKRDQSRPYKSPGRTENLFPPHLAKSPSKSYTINRARLLATSELANPLPPSIKNC